MGETYRELMVKREMGVKEQAMRIASMLGTVFTGMLTLMSGDFRIFILAAAFGALTYFVFLWTDIEYEYLYLDKEIIVDKVMAKSKRKRVAVIDVTKIEMMAPEGSDQLAYYKNRQVTLSDLSVGHDLSEQKLYAIYYEGSKKFMMNLDNEFVGLVKMIVPKRVFSE